MQIDAVLANHAEAVNNLLYLAGGGIELGFLPPGTPPPYRVSIGIGIMVTVPWVQTNQQHQVEVELLTEDGQPVQLQVTPEMTGALQLKMVFNVGRPAGLVIGDDQHVSLAANLPALPLPATGKYIFVVRLDGHDERKLAYRLVPAAGSQIATGPAAIGPIPTPPPSS
jgi:hypothetical protein